MCVGVFVHSVSRTFATRCVLAANPRCFGPWFIYSQLSWEQSENYMHKCHTGHSWKTGSSSAKGSGSLLMQCHVMLPCCCCWTLQRKRSFASKSPKSRRDLVAWSNSSFQHFHFHIHFQFQLQFQLQQHSVVVVVVVVCHSPAIITFHCHNFLCKYPVAALRIY